MILFRANISCNNSLSVIYVLILVHERGWIFMNLLNNHKIRVLDKKYG